MNKLVKKNDKAKIKRETAKVLISNMMNEFSLVMSTKKMLESYKWFSLASSVKDDELTLELMKEAIKEDTWQVRIPT
jgi:hypothetical protein